MDLPAALYLPTDDGYLATALTIGPWDPGLQHAGPPAALLAREAERVSAIDGGQTVRLAYDILAPVPVGPVRVSAQVVRPGRRIELVPRQATFALVMVEARLITLRSLGSVVCRFRQAM
jgi:hypothetical protein